MSFASLRVIFAILLYGIFTAIPAWAGTDRIDSWYHYALCEDALHRVDVSFAPKGLKQITREFVVGEFQGPLLDQIKLRVEESSANRKEMAKYLKELRKHTVGPYSAEAAKMAMDYLIRSPKLFRSHLDLYLESWFQVFDPSDNYDEDYHAYWGARAEELQLYLPHYIEALKASEGAAYSVWKKELKAYLDRSDYQNMELLSDILQTHGLGWMQTRDSRSALIEAKEIVAANDYIGLRPWDHIFLQLHDELKQKLPLQEEGGFKLKDFFSLDHMDLNTFEDYPGINRSLNGMHAHGTSESVLRDLVFLIRVDEMLRGIAGPSEHSGSLSLFAKELRDIYVLEPSPKYLEERRQGRSLKAEAQELFLAKVQRWQQGQVAAGEQSERQRWLYLGSLPAERAWKLNQKLKAIAGEAYKESIYETPEHRELSMREELLRLYPKHSLAYKQLVQFSGPLVAQIDNFRFIQTPSVLREVWKDAPEALTFNLVAHYGEHIWEQAESSRLNTKRVAKLSPEVIAHRFAEFNSALLAQGSRGNLAETEKKNSFSISDLKTYQQYILTGLSRDNFETTIWSETKRNWAIENMINATWTVLEGKASGAGNLVLQAEYRGTRFNVVVCVSEDCRNGLRPGDVATIYPACGHGVFLVPRTSKIQRTLDMLKEVNLQSTKKFREGWLKEKLCREDD